MRGLVERRSLAAALSKRARATSCARTYSAGSGRGRGEGLGRFGDTEESVLSSSYGHGVLLNSAGRGDPSSAGFLGRTGPHHRSNQTDATDGYSGPLLSHRAGSVSQRPGEPLLSNLKPPTKLSLNLGSSGFGRGKPVEKVSVPEDIFSSDSSSSLSSWSKWDEKSNKFDLKNGASLAESRLLADDESTNVLRFPPAPQQPRRLDEDGQTQGLQSSANATPFQGPHFQQPPPTSSHGSQPIQQTHMDSRVQPQPFPYASSSTGWQQPIQQSHYDARLQMQPFLQYSPSTGWQQSAGTGEPYPCTDKRAVSSELEFGKPYQGSSDWSREQPTNFSTATRVSEQGVAKSYTEATYVFNEETVQSQWASTHETNPQIDAAYAMGDWCSVSTSESMEPACPSQNFPGSYQGQYIYGSEAAQPPSAAPDVSDVSSYEYDWGQRTSESFQVTKEQLHVKAPIHVDKGSYYDEAIEKFFKQGKLEDIDHIYSQMRAAQVQVSAKTYGTILQSYMQLGKMDKASVIYQEMSGLLFSDKKTEDELANETSSRATGESPMLHSIEGVASSAEISSNAQGAPYVAEFEENGGFTPSRTSSRKDSLPSLSETDTRGFVSFGRSESIANTGMGRGKKMDSFFNFDFSGGVGSGARTHSGKESIQVGQGSHSEIHDDYNQTFTPVIEPGWYAFAPQGISVGPGAGRGRPHSPQAGDSVIGSSMPFPSEQFESGAGQGRSSYEQRMQVALQQSSPLYSRDVPAEPHYDYPEEPSQPTLSAEEAAERAMSILNAQVSRRYKKLESWERIYDDNATRVRRRSPLQLTQPKSLNEKKPPKKALKVEKEIHLTDEEAMKEAAQLKAIEENEALQELHHTFEQFMKCYGEMALEPEHELGDFTNPDIEEKPFMPLEEYLEKAKPNIMKTGLIHSEKEWQNMVNETLKHAPYFEEFVEMYSGPGRYTAKQENEDLEEIASALPSDVGRGAKAFVQRSLTTLKNNPGFNLDEKQWMLATMVEEFSQFAVTN